MPSFLHPGVYTLELPSNNRSIEGASTSTTIFVGETERGPLAPELLLNRTEYDRKFGGYVAPGGRLTLAYAMDQFYQNGGTKAYVLRAFGTSNRAAAKADSPEFGAASRNSTNVKLIASSAGKWADADIGAGTGLHALLLPASDNPTHTSPTRFRIVVLYTPLHLAGTTGARQIVENWDRLSADPNDENYVVDVLKRSLYLRWRPGAAAAIPAIGELDTILAGSPPAPISPTTEAELLSAPAAGNGFGGSVGGATDVATADYPAEFSQLDDIRDASLMVVPRARPLIGASAEDSNVYVIYGHAKAYVEARPQRDLFFIGDMARHMEQTLATEFTSEILKDYAGTSALNPSALPASDFTAVYLPWIISSDPVGKGRDPQLALPPSPAMAGLYARTDGNRGVWKAPAGVEATIAGVRRFEFDIHDIHQDLLNPRGLNANRSQPGAGPVVWGARTTQPGGQWRYIPVRRTAIFLRVSIYNGIQFAVFEPNDEPLWAALRLTVGGFMDRLFRQGAFAGSSPKDAYFVKCDAESTTAADQLAGVVNLLVGFTPLRPAEFVIMSLSQMARKS